MSTSISAVAPGIGRCWQRWLAVRASRAGIRFLALVMFPSHLAQAIGLLLVNALGVFAIVAPLVWLLEARRNTWDASDTISVAAVAILLLMTFGLSSNAMF